VGFAFTVVGCLIGTVGVRLTKTVAATAVVVLLAAELYGPIAIFTVALAF
jgi:hypothetical protein